jgi:transposase
MNACLLLPEAFAFRYSTIFGNTIEFGLMGSAPFGTCPLCQSASSKVHSYYQRKVGDLPISGKTVKLYVITRKFFCQQDSCPRKVFAERFGCCLKPWQRRLERYDEQLQAIGLHCGSKPGVRVCEVIGLPVSASTLLRVTKRAVLPKVGTPKVLGVDDFAFKKGHTYGTILVDLEKRVPVDLLPDREGNTLQEWLKAHPEVEIVTRDRSPIYANAITTACPDAIQVADRWHLLKNLSENLEKLLDSHRSLIKEAAQELSQKKVEELKKHNPAPSQPTESGIANPHLQAADSASLAAISNLPIPKEKRYEQYKEVKRLLQQGHPIRAITRHLGVSRNTVRKYLRQESFVPKTKGRRSNLLEYEDYLRKRWAEGETCAFTLYKEIIPLGYNGRYTILAAFLANYPKTPRIPALPPVEKGATFSSRSLSIALCREEDEWEEDQKPLLNKLLQKSELIRHTRDLSLEFKKMMEQKKGAELENWCQQASQLTSFKGFVRGIRQDFQAVQQAMSSSWSNGQTEGQVNRLKNLKRQMFGRAGFELLRIRVLARAG